jgi:hypothetical protein
MHTKTLQRIVDLAYEGRASRKPKAFLRQICDLADDEIDTANIVAYRGGAAEIRALDGTVLRVLP